MNFNSAKARLALLRAGLTEDDLICYSFHEFQLIHSPTAAQAYYQAQKEQVESNLYTFRQALSDIEKGISYSEFSLLGEPDSLLALVVDKQQFASKFVQPAKQRTIKPLDDRMHIVVYQNKQYVDTKEQQFTAKQGQFAANRTQLDYYLEQLRATRSYTLNNHLRSICERAKQVQQEMAYDGKRTFDMLKQAEEKRIELQNAQLEEKKRQIQEMQDKSNAMRQNVEYLNTETIYKAKELMEVVDNRAKLCVYHKAERDKEMIERQRYRDYARLQVIENSKKVQGELWQQKIADADAVKQKHEELVKSVLEYRTQKTLELSQTTMQALQYKSLAKAQIGEQREAQMLEKLYTYSTKAQEVEKQREQMLHGAKEALISKSLRKEQIRNRMMIYRRQQDFQTRLQSVYLIQDRSKFAKLDL